MFIIEGLDTIIADATDYPGVASRAMVRAINRAIASGRTLMVRSMAADTGMRQGDVRDSVPLVNATLSRPEARISASLRRIPLIRFRPSPSAPPSRGKGRGVSYRNPGAGRTRIPDAFIARMSSGHVGVFKRMTKGRLPIVELHGPSLGKVFEKFQPGGVARVQEAFAQNFDHELKFEQSRSAH